MQINANESQKYKSQERPCPPRDVIKKPKGLQKISIKGFDGSSSKLTIARMTNGRQRGVRYFKGFLPLFSTYKGKVQIVINVF